MSKVFILPLMAAEVFIGSTSGSLTPMVASHFAASGAANGFVRANESPLPRLDSVPLFIGLALFLAATVVWLIVLVRRFGRVP